MFKFALKNMAIKKAQMILIVLSILISASVGILAYNVASQVDDGITSTAGYYGVIIGPSGSATQLAMNTMYFTDAPLGTIPYSLVSELSRDTRVSSVIPYAMADNYNGSSVIGTTSEFLQDKALSDGEMFDDNSALEVVVGYTVAKTNRLSVGDLINTSHSASEEHNTKLKVVGILKKTNTVYDNVVFTQIRTIWEVHDDGDHEHEGEVGHATDKTVCAILVKTKNPSYATMIANEYNGKIYTPTSGGALDNSHSHGDANEGHGAGDTHEDHDEVSDEEVAYYSLQAIEPMSVVRGVLDEANNTKYIVFILCAIIIVMNIFIISIITLLNMYNSAKEISLMRLIGISMKKINFLYIIQNSIIGFISTALAFGVSRICMLFMGNYVESMGVVLKVSKIYPMEIVIMLAIFIISVLPTVICTFNMSRKDSISE